MSNSKNKDALRKKAEEILQQNNEYQTYEADDVTEFLEELQKQELKYREIFNNSNEAIFLFQFNNDGKPGNFVQVNYKASKLFDISYNEFLSLTPSDIDVNKNFVYINRAAKELQNGQKSQFEMSHQQSDGTYYPVEVDAHVIEIHGQKMGMAMVRDISERVEAQREIEETNARLKLAMEVGHLGWWDWDYEANIFVSADKKPALLGYDPKEVNFTAQDYIKKIHPDDYEKAMESMREHLQGKSEVYEVEYRLRKKDGSYIWLYDKGSVVERQKNGDPKRLMGVIFDISTRKEQEEQIRQREKNLQALLTNLDDFIFEQAADGTFLNVWTNDESKLFTSINNIIGHEPEEIFPSDFAEFNRKSIQEALENNQSVISTFKWMMDESIYYNAKLTPVKEFDTGESRLVILVRDVTDRENAKNLIKKQNEELKELNATKDKFFSIIAHDLKNPFNTLLGFTGELLKKHENVSPAERKNMIKTIHESARQNYSLLENLLVWSRMQSNRMPFNPERIMLGELIKDNAMLFKNTAIKKEVDLRVELNNEQKCWVKADREMINTVIRNLVSNALKYTPKGGVISVGCELAENKAVKVFVKDTGVGIKKETIPKLFQIEDTFSTEGTAHEKGTGLGLILVKEFIEKNNGELSIESTEGEGSVFLFTLKRVVQQESFGMDCFGDFDVLSDKILDLDASAKSYFFDYIQLNFRKYYKSYSSRKVNSFADEIISFALRYDLPELKNFGEKLVTSMNNFDINKLNICFGAFEKLFNRINEKRF